MYHYYQNLFPFIFRLLSFKHRGAVVRQPGHHVTNIGYLLDIFWVGLGYYRQVCNHGDDIVLISSQHKARQFDDDSIWSAIRSIIASFLGPFFIHYAFTFCTFGSLSIKIDHFNEIVNSLMFLKIAFQNYSQVSILF